MWIYIEYEYGEVWWSVDNCRQDLLNCYTSCKYKQYPGSRYGSATLENSQKEDMVFAHILFLQLEALGFSAQFVDLNKQKKS